MKKALVLLGLLILTFNVFAQVRIGPKAGINMSTTTQVENDLSAGYQPGYQFGLSMMFGKQVLFQPEILYTQKGVALKSSSNAVKYEYRYDYWQIPLLLNFGGGNGNYRLFVNFGPYISWWNSGKVKSHTDGVTEVSNYTFDEDFEDGLMDNRWDYGFSGGGGIGVKIASGWLMLEARYDYGFDDIRTMKDAGVYYQSIRNRTISGTLSYLWQF